MLMPRFSHGLWWDELQHKVLVFGGDSKSQVDGSTLFSSQAVLRQCEELGLERGAWQDLPSMKAGRAWFSPCEYSGYVYLCGYGSIEVFDPQVCIFLELSIPLPESKPCLVFVESQQLIVMSGSYITKWKTTDDHHLEQCFLDKHPEISVISSMAPVVDSVNEVVYVIWGGSCFSVCLDGSERRQVD